MFTLKHLIIVGNVLGKAGRISCHVRYLAHLMAALHESASPISKPIGSPDPPESVCPPYWHVGTVSEVDIPLVQPVQLHRGPGGKGGPCPVIVKAGRQLLKVCGLV